MQCHGEAVTAPSFENSWQQQVESHGGRRPGTKEVCESSEYKAGEDVSERRSGGTGEREARGSPEGLPREQDAARSLLSNGEEKTAN